MPRGLRQRRRHADTHREMHDEPPLPRPQTAAPGGQPVSLRVEGGGGLLASLVAAYVREACPAAVVTASPTAGESERGTRIVVEDTERWIYVSAERRPDGGAVEALSEGAAAVLTLDASREEFGAALDALLSEGQYVPSHIVRWLAGEALGRRGDRGGLPGDLHLTGREREILRLVAQGCSNQEIAGALTISANTVRTHLHTLSVKLDATSRTKMLANARALDIPEAFGHSALLPPARFSA